MPDRSAPAVATAPAALAAGAALTVLFWEPFHTLVRDWWNDPDAGHGLLLAPLAVILAYRSRHGPPARPQRFAGLLLLTAAVALRYASALAAELFTMRLSMLGAVAALVVYLRGAGYLRHWWLPASLLVLSIPLPSVLLQSLAFPLQLQASRMGGWLLALRDVPVIIEGNVIQLPGQSLFVTEACSGLRSLTALLSLGVLIAGLSLRRLGTRAALVLATLPVAMGLNAVRVFLTGFATFFVSPAAGQGVMHATEGWVTFVLAFAILGALALGLIRLEQRSEP